jgi:hypothetical protein
MAAPKKVPMPAPAKSKKTGLPKPPPKYGKLDKRMHIA